MTPSEMLVEQYRKQSDSLSASDDADDDVALLITRAVRYSRSDRWDDSHAEKAKEELEEKHGIDFESLARRAGVRV